MRILADRNYRSGSRWCVWRWTDVVLDGELYLTRLHLVMTPFGAIMLHWIMKPDSNPALHDHPCSFLSILLRGSYVEETPAGLTLIRWWNFKRASVADSHRITDIFGPGNALTLVLSSRKLREWGFHAPAGWVSWRSMPSGKDKQ